MRQLSPVNCTTAGYDVPYLKEQVRSSDLYLIPLNSNIDVTHITVNDISVGVEAEAVVQRCSVKKVFLEISQNSQENTCARVSFLITLLKKRLWHRCFPVNFAKFLRTPFLQNTSGGCFC